MKDKTVKRVVLFTSRSGGVGKTLATVAMTDISRNEFGLTVGVYDMDTRNRSLSEVLGSGSLLETSINRPNARLAVGDLVNCIDEGVDRAYFDTTCDCFDQAEDMLDGEGRGLNHFIETFEETGYRLTVAHVTAGAGSHGGIDRRWLEATGSRADHVEIRNTFLDEYIHPSGPEIPVIMFPVIHKAVVRKIWKTRMPFSALAKDGSSVRISDRACCKAFLKELHGELRSSGTGHLFGLPI